MSDLRKNSRRAARESRGCAMPADEDGAAFKLRAEDADDLAVISACLQDALVAVRGITFGAVVGVSYHGFRRSEDARILSLLAIRPGRDGEEDAILLEFSDGAAIRLGVSRILCHAQDLGEPWPTPWQPRHDADERV